MEIPDNDKNNTKLFIPKGNGLGWTLNFANKWSYVILLLILGFIACSIIFGLNQKG